MTCLRGPLEKALWPSWGQDRNVGSRTNRGPYCVGLRTINLSETCYPCSSIPSDENEKIVGWLERVMA